MKVRPNSTNRLYTGSTLQSKKYYSDENERFRRISTARSARWPKIIPRPKLLGRQVFFRLAKKGPDLGRRTSSTWHMLQSLDQSCFTWKRGWTKNDSNGGIYLQKTPCKDAFFFGYFHGGMTTVSSHTYILRNPTSGLYIFRVQARQRFFRLEALGLFLVLGVRQQRPRHGMLPNTPWPAGCSSGVGGFKVIPKLHFRLEVIGLIHLWCLESVSYHRMFVVWLQGNTPPKTNISSENQWLEIGRFIFLLGCHIFRRYVGFREGNFNCRKINANANQSTCAIFTLSRPTFTGRWCCPQFSSATSWKVFMNLDQYGHVSNFYIHHGWIADFLANKWRHIWHNSLGSLQGNVSFLIRNLAGNEHLGMAKTVAIGEG